VAPNPPPPAPPPPKPVLRGVVKAAKCSARPAPEYPAKAQQAGVGAEVRVHIYMGKDGVPTDVKVISNTAPDRATQRLFATAVSESARGFRCEGSEETYILEQDFGFKPE
jgi:TonB family protein